MLVQTRFNPPMEALERISTLEEVLLDPNPKVLRYFSQSGHLGELIPEWQRLIGARNTQHATHHFLLDDHTLRVIERIKNSSYYRSLTDYQQFLTTLSALLHDIDKNTGPARLYGKISVDKLHPVKSAEMSRAILTRMIFPPKSIQRVYTLIHHHQAFGRLFILYKEKAPRQDLRKIALKIRSVSLLDCLLALSEGDIRGVQRKDAFFTPRVAELMAEYASTVREDIVGFRPGIAMFPQNLILIPGDHWQLYLEQSASFVLPAQSWEELFEALEAIRWGGASVVPYFHKLSELRKTEIPCAALLRFLPENIAYWGPDPYPVNHRQMRLSSMALFYGLLQGEPLQSRESLSASEQLLLSQCLALKQEMKAMLEAVSLRQGYGNWRESISAFEEGWFEPSDHPLPVDPLLQEVSRTYQELYPGKPAIGIATRPILMGFYTTMEQKPIPSGPWENVPVFLAM